MTDIAMTPDMYAGPQTPFGGPSLEWHFNNTVITKEDSDEKTRIGVRGLPLVIQADFTHLRRMLTQEFPRTEANIHRKIINASLPIVERFVEAAPQHQKMREEAFMSITSTSDTREWSMKRRSNYEINLGAVEPESTSIYVKNSDQVSRIRNMAEDLGISPGIMTIICLSAGLAQSVDTTWVPLTIREATIKEVKFFQRWLHEVK
jgi:hypothetical protein